MIEYRKSRPAASPRSALPPFDPNDYRKRVLAAVLRRGGPDESDPFELYDLPLSDDLDDAEVAARVAEVWGAWQRQRDHPKYRVLVGLLVAGHEARRAELTDPLRRVSALAAVRARRRQREADRYSLLDAAIARLVERHRGVPREKVEGLYEVGAMNGLTRAEVDARLRRHRLVDTPVAGAGAGGAAEPAISADRRRQIRSLLEEFGRLVESAPPATLLALLEVGADAGGEQIRARAGAWRARARELPAARMRTVVDELLVHVAELLEPGPAAVQAYLDAVAADVTDALRPRVRAAVLVEDRLTSDDHAHLLGEATALGLDPARARAVLAVLGAELGVPVDESGPMAAPAPGSGRGGGSAVSGSGRGGDGRSTSGAGRGGTPAGSAAGRADGAGAANATGHGATAGHGGTDGAAGRRDGAAGGHTGAGRPDSPGRAGGEEALRLHRALETLKDARHALRRGRPAEAQRLVREAEELAGSAGSMPPIRAMVDEVADVLAEAETRWRTANAAAGAKRWVEAREQLDHLARTASDAPPPRGTTLERMLGVTERKIADADAAVAAALSGPASAQVAALRAVLLECADHPGATAALDAVPVAPPAGVRAERDGRGDVVVSWAVSATAGVTYKVERLHADGRRQVIGRTADTTLIDGGAPAGPLPVYVVAAVQDGRSSDPVRTDTPPPDAPTAATPAPESQPRIAYVKRPRPAGRGDGPAPPRSSDGPPPRDDRRPRAAGPDHRPDPHRSDHHRPGQRSDQQRPGQPSAHAVPPTRAFAPPGPLPVRPAEPTRLGVPLPPGVDAPTRAFDRRPPEAARPPVPPGAPTRVYEPGAHPVPPPAAPHPGSPPPAAQRPPAPLPPAPLLPTIPLRTPPGGVPHPPNAVRAERTPTGGVVIHWAGVPGAEFRVRCLLPDGRWRTVGRTHDTFIEDGGAPDGPLPTYAVSAALNGERSPEVTS